MARRVCPFQEATLFLEPSQYQYSPPAHSCLPPSSPFPGEERKVLTKKSPFVLLAGMAPEWELGMGMDIGFGTGGYASHVATTTTPPAYLYGLPSTDTLRIDDLLDFSNYDLFPTAASVTDAHLVPQQEPSSAAGSAPYLTGDTDSSSSSHHYYHHHHCPQLNSLPDDLFVPSEEAAELEWLSKFVDDSFSDAPYSSTCELLAPSINTNTRIEHSVPGRGARSKRSRNNTGAAGAMNQQNTAWSSLTPLSQSPSSTTSSSSSSEFPPSKLKPSNNDNHNSSSSASSSGSTSNKGKKMTGDGVGVGVEGGVRRCTHCSSEKTPQWRTGPLGPKTLCNACGVRYKSGRLVPEYRPAASPTFVLTQHSNSHRKVLELRRQKELLLLNPPSAAPTAASGTASAALPELLFPNYEVC